MKEINSLMRISNYRPFLLKVKTCPSFHVKYRPSMTELDLLTSIFEIYMKFPKFWCIETLFSNLSMVLENWCAISRTIKISFFEKVFFTSIFPCHVAVLKATTLLEDKQYMSSLRWSQEL